MTTMNGAENAPLMAFGVEPNPGDLVIRHRFNDVQGSDKFTVEIAVAELGHGAVQYTEDEDGYVIPISLFYSRKLHGMYRERGEPKPDKRPDVSHEGNMLVKHVIDNDEAADTAVKRLVDNELFIAAGRAWEATILGTSIKSIRPLMRALWVAIDGPEVTSVITPIMARDTTDTERRAFEVNYGIGKMLGEFMIVSPKPEI